MFYVYVIQNENKKLYYGFTNDLRKRFFDHNNNKSFATKKHKWRLIYYEAYLNKYDAREREKRLKNYGQALGQLKRRIKKSLSIS